MLVPDSNGDARVGVIIIRISSSSSSSTRVVAVAVVLVCSSSSRRRRRRTSSICGIGMDISSALVARIEEDVLEFEVQRLEDDAVDAVRQRGYEGFPEFVELLIRKVFLHLQCTGVQSVGDKMRAQQLVNEIYSLDEIGVVEDLASQDQDVPHDEAPCGVLVPDHLALEDRPRKQRRVEPELRQNHPRLEVTV
jgi:hypothetical protein